MLDNAKQLIKILVRGQTNLIKFALISLPVILVFVFYSLFMTQNIVNAFEKHMYKSYFGIFGDLQLVSEVSFLEALYQSPKLAHLKRSYRVTAKTVLLFEGESTNVLKGVDIIAYEQDYLSEKFAETHHYRKGSLILSAVAFNQLGADKNPIKSIYNPINKLTAGFERQVVVDFGFLGSQPIVVMSIKDFQKLKLETLAFNQVEFNGLTSSNIIEIENLANSLLKEGFASDYQIINQKTLTQEARNVFEMIEFFRYVFFFILISVCFTIYFLAIKLLMNTKKVSLTILECLGMPKFKIIFTLLNVIMLVTLLCLILSYLLAAFSTESLLFFMGIPASI